MPQMKPMNWVMLFTLMNLIIMFMNIKNFYNKNMNLSLKKLTISKKMKNWSW